MRWLIFFIIGFFVFMSNAAVTQSYTLQVRIKNQPDNPVVLGTLSGDKFTPVDTLELQVETDLSPVEYNSQENGQQVKRVNYRFPEDVATSMYRLVFGQTTYAKVMGESPQQLDFIFNKEDIVFETGFKAPEDSLKVLQSEENKVWFRFLHEEKKLGQQLDELEMEVDYFQEKLAAAKSSSDPGLIDNLPDFEMKAEQKANEFNELQLQKDLFITQTAAAEEHLFAARLISTFREPFRDGYLTSQEREKSFQKEYFRHLDFSDESLINSPVLTEKVFSYLVTCNQTGFSREQREQAYMEAVDVVMRNIGQENFGHHLNNPVYEFILSYLVNGFEGLKMDRVLTYIAEKYAGTFCKTDEKTTLQRKLEAQKMKVGTVVPDFTLNDLNGDPVTLSDILKARNLIVFWASWCPHCNEMLPMIKSWAAQKKAADLEIIAISLDGSKSKWKEAVYNTGFEMFYNLSDLKEWDGKVAEDYNVYATPTFFITDQNGIIQAKPIEVNELMEL
jgi:peroxiredoxin